MELCSTDTIIEILSHSNLQELMSFIMVDKRFNLLIKCTKWNNVVTIKNSVPDYIFGMFTNYILECNSIPKKLTICNTLTIKSYHVEQSIEYLFNCNTINILCIGTLTTKELKQIVTSKFFYLIDENAEDILTMYQLKIHCKLPETIYNNIFETKINYLFGIEYFILCTNITCVYDTYKKLTDNYTTAIYYTNSNDKYQIYIQFNKNPKSA